MSEIRIQKINGQEFVTLTDYLRLKEQKQELEYLGDINEELKEEKQKLQEHLSNSEKSADDYITKLEEENKKLKEELNEWVNGAINYLRETPPLNF